MPYIVYVAYINLLSFTVDMIILWSTVGNYVVVDVLEVGFIVGV